MDYKDFLQKKTFDNLNQKSKDSLQQMLSNKSLINVIKETNELLQYISLVEKDYIPELEVLAVNIIKQLYPIIERENINIDAKIVQDPPELNGDMKMKMGDGDEEDEEDEDDLINISPEIKRRIINGISQGASIRGAFAFYLFNDNLDKINNNLIEKYGALLRNAFGIYDSDEAVAMLLAMLANNQKVAGGTSEVEIENNEDDSIITIIARAINFPTLLHEIVKGLFELISLQGFKNLGADQAKKVAGNVDKLQNEPYDLRYGKFIYDALNDLVNQSNYDNPSVKEYFFAEVYQLNDDEFISFIENLVNNELTSSQKKWVQDTIRDIEKDIKSDDYDDLGIDERIHPLMLRKAKLSLYEYKKKNLINESQGIKAYHGSPVIFRKFQYEGIGGGAGSQILGYGFYTTTDIGMAISYVKSKLKSNTTQNFLGGLTHDELGLKYENEVFFTIPHFKSNEEYIEYAQEMLDILQDEDFEGIEDVKNNYKQIIQIIKDLEIQSKPTGALYVLTLFPNITPNLIMNQVLNKEQIKLVYSQAEKENLPEFEKFVSDRGISSSPISVLSDYFDKIKPRRKNDGTITYNPESSFFLKRAGIDGIKGFGPVYVVFDKNDIRIDKIITPDQINNNPDLLKEYSDKIIQQMTKVFQKEMRNTLSNDDIKDKLNRFDQIKKNIPQKVKTGQMQLPGKFKEPDPKTKKLLNPLDITLYSWKELEAVLDSYGDKSTKTSSDNYTTLQADEIKINGVDIIHDQNNIKIYDGSNYESCVKMNYAFKYPDEEKKWHNYSFCIGRKEDASNQYFTYRFGRGGSFRTFYFVVDKSQSPTIVGNPADRNNFTNWYHLFVIHAFDNGTYGVTDAVNQYGADHEFTNNDKGTSWEQIGQFMVTKGKESGKSAWDKIKNLKDYFVYKNPSDEEKDQALVRDNVLNFESFSTLSRNQKKIYISRRADQPNAFTSQMFRILDSELKNLALRTGKGYKPSYEDLKNSPSLGRSYAKFTFAREIKDKSNPFALPLPFVQYLDENEKEIYMNTFDENLTFEYIEKYFGKQQAQNYVNNETKKLEYLPLNAIKYIQGDELKKLYSIYNKLTTNWETTSNTNIDEEELQNLTQMPPQVITPEPLTYENVIKDFSANELNTIINLVNKYDKNPQYSTLLCALPFVVKDKGNLYLLLPLNKNNSQEWVLITPDKKIINRYKNKTLNYGYLTLNQGYILDFDSDQQSYIRLLDMSKITPIDYTDS